MANVFIFTDNAYTALAAPAAAAATTMTLAAGTGARFPSPGAGEQFTFSLFDAATGLVTEIVYCTSRATDVLTVVRAREGTAAADWTTGTPCIHGPTAGTMAAFGQTAATNGKLGYWPAGGSANALTITPSPVFDAYATGMSFQVKIATNNSAAATLNVNGLGTKDIRDQNGVALTADQLVAGRTMWMTYTGTFFALVTTPPVATFIATLTTKSPLDGTEEVAVSDASSKLAGKTTLNAIATFSQSNNFQFSYFLGMM